MNSPAVTSQASQHLQEASSPSFLASALCSPPSRREQRTASEDAAVDALFKKVDAEIETSIRLSRQNKFEESSTALRRAFEAASGRLAVAGSPAYHLAARVARAAVAVQHSGLMSRFDFHAQALDEALAAARETEEVWHILLTPDLAKASEVGAGADGADSPPRSPLASLLQQPPKKWLERAAVASVQARHCVGLELEFTLQGEDAPRFDPGFTPEDRWDLIGALHSEGCWLADKFLPPDHGMQALSAKAEASARVRREEWLNRPKQQGAPSQKPQQRRQGPARLYPSSPVADTVRGGKSSSNSPETLQKKLDRLDSDGGMPRVFQMLAEHKEGRRRPHSAGACRPPSPSGRQKKDGFLRRGAADRIDFEPRSDGSPTRRFGRSPAPVERHWATRPASATATCEAGGDKSRPSPSRLASRIKEDTRTRNVFDEWLRGHGRFGQSALHQRLATSLGVQELHKDMRRRSLHFKNRELPLVSGDQLFENRTVFSAAGMAATKIGKRWQQKCEEKPVSPQSPRYHFRLREAAATAISVVVPSPGMQTAVDFAGAAASPNPQPLSPLSPQPPPFRSSPMFATPNRSKSPTRRCSETSTSPVTPSVQLFAASSMDEGGAATAAVGRGATAKDVLALRLKLSKSFVKAGSLSGFLSAEQAKYWVGTIPIYTRARSMAAASGISGDLKSGFVDRRRSMSPSPRDVNTTLLPAGAA
eukprot:TRINITY_DN44517_c0_g1_i1.p1 TRINITY_DN44517_c0_g1~~TRINITY_DN44517_c0_g1_i1.p1  ORF type:complete len:707 (+),score=160.92 TRINITY_DN44517_c0_g1_i1:109-2229(+)